MTSLTKILGTIIRGVKIMKIPRSSTSVVELSLLLRGSRKKVEKYSSERTIFRQIFSTGRKDESLIQLQESFAIMSHRVAPGDEDSFSSSSEDENSDFEESDSSELEIIDKSESSLVNFEGSSATDLSFSESEEDDSETTGQSYLFLLM